MEQKTSISPVTEPKPTPAVPEAKTSPKEPSAQEEDKLCPENKNESHRVYEWTPEMTEKAKKLLEEDKVKFNDNMYSTSLFLPDLLERLERESAKYWNLFYKHNQTNFFKDRHYIMREFPEMLETAAKLSPADLVLLDVGCGVGNAFFPMLEHIPNLRVHAMDFSQKAVELIKVGPGCIIITMRV